MGLWTETEIEIFKQFLHQNLNGINEEVHLKKVSFWSQWSYSVGSLTCIPIQNVSPFTASEFKNANIQEATSVWRLS